MKYKFKEDLETLRLEIRSYESFEEKLKKWAEFTVEYCNEIAENKNRTYYVFQSEPRYEPDVLILGLNPGGNFTFESQIEKEGWGLKQHGKMISEILIHQNPWYFGGKEEKKEKEWNILRNLNKTINVHSEVSGIFDNMVYMNILYFNSKDFAEFKSWFKESWKDVFENCMELSKLLIFDIIKPKRILCLSIDNCYRPFTRNQQSEQLLTNLLNKSEINGICIYGMTHPSARKTNFERENIGWHLYADWFKKPIFNDILKKLTIIEKLFLEIANELNLKLNFDNTRNGVQFASFKFIILEEPKVSIYFEFQQSFYSDLRFELFNDGFVNKAKQCISPYNNWVELDEYFNPDDFKNYFNNEIYSLLSRLGLEKSNNK
jgi:hypothetical protein